MLGKSDWKPTFRHSLFFPWKWKCWWKSSIMLIKIRISLNWSVAKHLIFFLGVALKWSIMTWWFLTNYRLMQYSGKKIYCLDVTKNELWGLQWLTQYRPSREVFQFQGLFSLLSSLLSYISVENAFFSHTRKVRKQLTIV